MPIERIDAMELIAKILTLSQASDPFLSPVRSWELLAMDVFDVIRNVCNPPMSREEFNDLADRLEGKPLPVLGTVPTDERERKMVGCALLSRMTHRMDKPPDTAALRVRSILHSILPRGRGRVTPAWWADAYRRSYTVIPKTEEHPHAD